MEQQDINYLREQRQNHLKAIQDIQRRAELFMAQYQTALEHEIHGVEYCEKTLTEAGIPIEEEPVAEPEIETPTEMEIPTETGTEEVLGEEQSSEGQEEIVTENIEEL